MGARPPRTDIAIAAALVVVSQIETWMMTVSAQQRATYAVLALAACASLAWRRTHPVVSAAVFMSSVVADVGGLSGVMWPVAAIPLSLFSAGRNASSRGAIAILGLGVLFDVALGFTEPSSSVGEYLLNFLFILVTMVGLPWAAGYALRLRAVETERRASAAVAEERRRIAREIHDVVGHALGVIVVQAGAERATLPIGAPASTRETLTVIERTGRNALAEMRRLVDLMNRSDRTEGARMPPPGVAQLQHLVDSVGAAGLSTRLRVEGRQVTLPAGLDLSAYRVVQEALTNSLRHAGPARAEVTLRYLPSALEIEVADNGQGPARPSHSPGHGLTGMRERVSLFSGSMRSGPLPGGGFAVQVRLPIDQLPVDQTAVDRAT